MTGLDDKGIRGVCSFELKAQGVFRPGRNGKRRTFCTAKKRPGTGGRGDGIFAFGEKDEAVGVKVKLILIALILRNKEIVEKRKTLRGDDSGKNQQACDDRREEGTGRAQESPYGRCIQPSISRSGKGKQQEKEGEGILTLGFPEGVKDKAADKDDLIKEAGSVTLEPYEELDSQFWKFVSCSPMTSDR